MVVLKKLEFSDRKIQKNRFFKKPKTIRFIFGDSAILNLKEGRLELIQINSTKKFLKKLIKKKKNKLSFIREKIWYFGRVNFFLQRKPKNSRMGKGKGDMERKVIRLQKNFVLFEFKGINYYKINWFLRKLNKISNLRFTVIFKKITYYRLWFKPKLYSYFYKKYLNI